MNESDRDDFPVDIVNATPDMVVARAEPVITLERVASIDVMRGVALLGILAMNIVHFAWPEVVYDNPTRAPGHTWADIALWVFNQFMFNTKMMTIFSMLFGAGLVLMSDRADQRELKLGRVYYRRIFVLLGMGLIHAYLIWSGDILVMYALCGLFLYPFRRRSGRFLIITGITLMLLIVPSWLMARRAVQYLDETAIKKAAGDAMPPWREDLLEIRTKLRPDQITKDREFDKTVTTHRSDYQTIVADRTEDNIEFEGFGFILFMWWYVGGRMLLGMGLMKLGVFSGQRSTRFYVGMMAVGYGLGFPLVLCSVSMNWFFDFFMTDGLSYMTGGWWIPHELSGPLVALGHVGTVMLIYQHGLLQGLTRRLAAVGRMALTNYLTHSIVFTTVFYGYGLKLYATVHRPGLVLMVLAMWTIQLSLSPLWLRYFRFGPAEWLWRTLTYGTTQPFLHPPIDRKPVEIGSEGLPG